MGRLDFVIIGAMKCATSSLHAQLAMQAGIRMSEPKEPNFFGDDDTYGRGLAWYESLFGSVPKGWLCGESSTHYSKRDEYPRACARLHQHDPDLRIVYVMRHPIARLVSHYRHEWTEGKIRKPIDQAVLEHPALTLQSCYAWQIAPYLRRFGPDRVLPVFFERLSRWPQAELERVARHVGADAGVVWREDLGTFNRSADRRRRNLQPIRRPQATGPRPGDAAPRAGSPRGREAIAEPDRPARRESLEDRRGALALPGGGSAPAPDLRSGPGAPRPLAGRIPR